MSSIHTIKTIKKVPKQFFVVITGPTGVGKTALIEELARISTLRFAVINGDMGQLYTPLSIGTAKPNLAHQRVTHYLFDILDTPRNFTVHEYRVHAQSCLEMLWKSGTVPVVVGGSGFYIKSLFFAPHNYTLSSTRIQSPEPEYKHKPEYAQYTNAELWQKLKMLDPERAAHIHEHDRYRIIRALTIYAQTGLLPSTFTPVYSPVGQALILYLTREKQELYTRIEHRIDQMFDAGWLKEVDKLSPAWRDFICQKKIIGYPEIIEYLTKKYSEKYKGESNTQEQLDMLKAIIAQRTKAYAKRQQTFWRSFKQQLSAVDKCPYAQEIQEINLTFTDLGLYTKQLEQILELYTR